MNLRKYVATVVALFAVAFLGGRAMSRIYASNSNDEYVKVRVKREVDCSDCDGDGRIWFKCKSCDGAGKSYYTRSQTQPMRAPRAVATSRLYVIDATEPER